MFRSSSLWFAFISGAALLGCSGTDNTSPSTSGGNSGVGGALGGASNTGGRTAAGGGAGTGGVPTFAGAGGTGGSLGTGGAVATGATGTGGSPGTCSLPTIRITEVDVGAAKAARVQQKSAAPAVPLQAGGETILVVEDDPSLLLVNSRILERCGRTVLRAANGAEAVKVWNENHERISILLTDLVLPGGMSGLEVAQASWECAVRDPIWQVFEATGNLWRSRARRMQW